MDGTVLIADDDRTIRTVLTQALTRAGCRVHATSSLTTLMRWIDEGRGDLVISDVVMPDGNGLEMLPVIGQRRPGLPVIVISAQNTIMTAIQAAEAEAYDYLPKPFDLPDLMKRVARGLGGPRTSATTPRNDVTDQDLPLVGRSPVMQDLYRLIARVLHSDLPILVTGESGTGKSLIVRAIHDLSDRRGLPFVAANASDLAGPDAAQSILARARAGTILFDQLDDIERASQAQIVRLLEKLGDNAPRIMATAQNDLGEQIEDGSFRSDLFYRLSGVLIAVPPLRARVEDIALLAGHFLEPSDRGPGTQVLEPAALELMRSYTWPGNVRQLENVIRRLAVTAAEDAVTVDEVRAVLGNQPSSAPTVVIDGEKLGASVDRHLRRYFDLHGGVLPPQGLYGRILREIEMPLIEIALEATGGNQAKCAELLGINRNTLRKKITELDIRVTRRRKLM